jgi:hypothetical protein
MEVLMLMVMVMQTGYGFNEKSNFHKTDEQYMTLTLSTFD